MSKSRFGGHRATEAPHFARERARGVKDLIRYDKMVEAALRGVVREVHNRVPAVAEGCVNDVALEPVAA